MGNSHFDEVAYILINTAGDEVYFCPFSHTGSMEVDKVHAYTQLKI
jgi:hypothetical protein